MITKSEECRPRQRQAQGQTRGRPTSVPRQPKTQKQNKMEEIILRLDAIERYCLLAAKTVLTFEECILLTGFSKSHLYKLTCTHQIPHYKPNGKQIYFDRGEVEAWMKQNRVQTTAEAEQIAAAHIVANRQKGGRV